MPKYNVDKGFWLKGVKIEAGTTVHLREAEAKYLGHAVSLVDKPKAAAVEAAPAVEVVAETPMVSASVTEVDGGKRQKR
jgi:hypothetical protein